MPAMYNACLPPAKQLHLESELVQEQIRKTQQKQDLGKKVEEKLQHKVQQGKRQKILIIANRLPSSPKRDKDGNWTFTKCSGGLVSCLAGIQRKFDMVWLGWPGSEIPDCDKEVVATQAMKQGCYPVFLSQDLIEQYYNGFANNVLWPLFHYIMPPFDRGVHDCSAAQWEAYKRANELFVDAILSVYEEDDYVWVHDYHLMLVPKILRIKKPSANIGWFLHTPFPSAEIYRTLPWRQELIESLLHANLLGFHVYDYMRHFLSSCVHLTSLEVSQHTVDATSIGGCVVTCSTVPIGISPEEFVEALEKQEVKLQVEKLKEQYGGRKVILGIDRLDYMKGIPHKLRAFGCFLDTHPDWAANCVLVQLAVPSRRDVPEYQRLQRQVHELVGQICGKHSKVATGAPVIYLDASMNFSDLVALYQVADVCMITSLRDGMNLVSYEYVVSQQNNDPPGVLILSEFAGAAQSLGAGSIRVNPWNLQDTAEAIHEALTMPKEERFALHRYACSYVKEHTARKWAETFLQSLQEACSNLLEVTAEVPSLLNYEEFLDDWSGSTHRLIVLDLLECLVPGTSKLSKVNVPARGELGRRKKAHFMPPELKASLLKIASHPNTTVVLTSDKSREALAGVAGGLPVILAAEGCTVYRRIGGEEWLFVQEDEELKGLDDCIDGVEAVFQYFTVRTPGSHIEKQEHQLRWYFDDTQHDFGSAQAREVLIHLWAGPLVNSEAEVVVSNRSITVRPHSCSRSACLEKLLQKEVGQQKLEEVDFALCFATVSHRDEDVFESLQNLLDLAVGPAEDTDAVADEERKSVKSSKSSGSLKSEEGDPKVLHTPRHVPQVRDGEEPPEYDWIPTAQREGWDQASLTTLQKANSLPPSPATNSASGALLKALSVTSDVLLPPPDEERLDSLECRGYVFVYTLSLGMKKTKAQYALPHPYHVQNLVRSMAARLPICPAERPEAAGA